MTHPILNSLKLFFATPFFCSIVYGGEEDIKLVRPLGYHSDPTLSHQSELPEEKFLHLVDGALEFLGNPRMEPSRLSFPDTLTILETAISGIKQMGRPSFAKAGLHHMRLRQALVGFLNPRTHVRRDALQAEIDSTRRRPTSSWWWRTDDIRQSSRADDILKDLDMFEALLGLIRKSEALTEKDSRWIPVRDQAYQTARDELSRLDWRLKLVHKTDPAIAGRLAEHAVDLILFRPEDPRTQRMAINLLEGIEEKLQTDGMPTRFFSDTIETLAAKVATPLRPWAFRGTLAAGVLSAASLASGLDITSNELASISETAGVTWIALLIFSKLAAAPLIGLGYLADLGISHTSKLILPNRMGTLARPLISARERCMEALASAARPHNGNQRSQ